MTLDEVGDKAATPLITGGVESFIGTGIGVGVGVGIGVGVGVGLIATVRNVKLDDTANVPLLVRDLTRKL